MDTGTPLFDESGHLVDNKKFQNYFDIYGFQNNQLNLNDSQITDIYLSLSKQIHPDLFSSASSDQKILSIHYSEMVNNGYQVLKNPFKRARYFLEINKELNENKDIPPEVIDDVFEIQELLEKDSLNESDQIELENFVERFTNIQKDYSKKLQQLFIESENMHKPDLVQKLNQLISANSYVQRIFTNIDAKQELSELK